MGATIMRTAVTKIKRQLRQSLREHLFSGLAAEMIYRQIFLRELAKENIVDNYFPVGAAANHSLLYFLLRCIRTFEIQKVVEFGCGQTTLLIRDLKSTRPNLNIISYESDPAWAERLLADGADFVRQVPLQRVVCNGEHLPFYRIDSDANNPDLVILDGPIGPQSRGRLAAVEALVPLLHDDFIVVIDDVHRAPEAYTADAFDSALRQRGVRVSRGILRGEKWQAVLAAGRFTSAAAF